MQPILILGAPLVGQKLILHRDIIITEEIGYRVLSRHLIATLHPDRAHLLHDLLRHVSMTEVLVHSLPITRTYSNTYSCKNIRKISTLYL